MKSVSPIWLFCKGSDQFHRPGTMGSSHLPFLILPPCWLPATVPELPWCLKIHWKLALLMQRAIHQLFWCCWLQVFQISEAQGESLLFSIILASFGIEGILHSLENQCSVSLFPSTAQIQLLNAFFCIPCTTGQGQWLRFLKISALVFIVTIFLKRPPYRNDGIYVAKHLGGTCLLMGDNGMYLILMNSWISFVLKFRSFQSGSRNLHRFWCTN